MSPGDDTAGNVGAQVGQVIMEFACQAGNQGPAEMKAGSMFSAVANTRSH